MRRDGALEQDGGDPVPLLVVADVEPRAEHAHVESAGRHHEGSMLVVRDLEVGLALHRHAALAREEGATYSTRLLELSHTFVPSGSTTCERSPSCV